MTRKELPMTIKPSSALRNNTSGISALAKETQEPVYITVNGEGDGVFMDNENWMLTDPGMID